MTAGDDNEDQPADLRRWLEGEVERRHPEAAQVRAEYAGWLVGFLEVSAGTRTAAGIRVEAPAGGSDDALWEPGVHYVIRQVPETRRRLVPVPGNEHLRLGSRRSPKRHS